QVDLRTGDLHTEDLAVTTPEGAVAAARAEHEAPLFRALAAREHAKEERTIHEVAADVRRRTRRPRLRRPGLRRPGATRSTRPPASRQEDGGQDSPTSDREPDTPAD